MTWSFSSKIFTKDTPWWPLFTMKTLSSWYRDSHYKPEIVVRPSQVYNGDSYIPKTASFNWIEAYSSTLRVRYGVYLLSSPSGGRFKNIYELLNLRALKFSYVNKIHIFQCMGKIFCEEFQRYPLKFHTKCHAHTLKDTILIQHWNFKSS